MARGLLRTGAANWRRRRRRAPEIARERVVPAAPPVDDSGSRPVGPVRFELERVERCSESTASALLRVRGRWWSDEPTRVPSPSLLVPGEFGVRSIEPLRGGDVELAAGPDGPSWGAAYPVLGSFADLPEEMLAFELATGQVMQLREPAAVTELRDAVAEETEARLAAERQAVGEAQARVELEQRVAATEQRALAAEASLAWLGQAWAIRLAEMKEQLAGEVVEAGRDTERAAGGIERALIQQRTDNGPVQLAADQPNLPPASGSSPHAFDIEPAEMLALQLKFEGSSREQVTAYLTTAFGLDSADEVVARAFGDLPGQEPGSEPARGPSDRSGVARGIPRFAGPGSRRNSRLAGGET